MLRAHNLHIQRGRKAVLSEVSLQLQPGEVLGVLGPNGAGKSTLLGALCGELTASEGEVSLDGEALSRWTGVQRAQRLAVLPQVSTLDFAFRVEEVVGMGRLPYQSGRVRDDEIIVAALAAADAGHLSGRSYLALSGASVSACIWRGCWRNCGRVRLGKRCCLMNRRRCSIHCINTQPCRRCASLPIAARRCW